ncbi:methyl-accepting chemotaxis protein [Alkalimonas delamerensis]|uniref:Methyl-accepting chemotaxis protein n=1 Tax=Alkalimonas delamerensis TaxID=265981 RepID=A0ABT9GSE5_9GAMM|nr:methyl-accepting chemotaxis protein [Alkalimonas delamerensis]MDP4529556.1 methyl-accepting chemotaxis protein [Alkalimonas delamerensis]
MLANLSIRYRLLLLIGIPLLAMLLMVALSLSSMQSINQSTQELHFEMQEQQMLTEVRQSLVAQPMLALLSYQQGQQSAAETARQLQAGLAQSERTWQQFRAVELPDNEMVFVRQAEQVLPDLRNSLTAFSQALQSGEDYSALVIALVGQSERLQRPLNELLEIQMADANEFAAEAQHQYQSNMRLFFIIIAVILLVVVALALLVYRSIQHPLEQLNQVMQQVEHSSDLTLRANQDGRNELSTLAQCFNRLMGHFQKVLFDVEGASNQVAAASEQLSSVSQEVSQIAASQEMQTAQIATAITEMAAAVQEVARSAQVALESTETANEQASDGLNAVEKNMEIMELLSGSILGTAERLKILDERIQEIAKVIEVIQGIAEQTNLLALNAAIEAARAGEQGRGFAVVADEVRALASNTKQSTESIQQTMERLRRGANEAVEAMQSSSTQADESLVSSKETGGSFQSVSKAIRQVVDVNVQISTATEEQANVANDITESVNTMASSVTEVVTGANQCAQASAELSELAQRLKDHVNRFKIAS